MTTIILLPLRIAFELRIVTLDIFTSFVNMLYQKEFKKCVDKKFKTLYNTTTKQIILNGKE